ncbi:hypothetical protein C6558_32235 [Ensifer sp. NM-2]|nr:hypothetical protein C6558_32235 [Ensifer sp. NM-2]
MSRVLNDCLGSELGLDGCYANMRAAEIVNNARARFISLSSRLTAIQNGATGAAIATDPAWPGILQEIDGMLARFPAMADDAIVAAAFSDEVLDLEEEIDHIVAVAERTTDEP